MQLCSDSARPSGDLQSPSRTESQMQPCSDSVLSTGPRAQTATYDLIDHSHNLHRLQDRPGLALHNAPVQRRAA
jgi:hypothetical protein